MNETSTIQIRDARPDDRETIQKVTLDAYQQYSKDFPPPIWEGYKEDMLETSANSDMAAEQIVAELDGEIVGTVLLFPAGSITHDPDDNEIVREWPEFRLLAVAPSGRAKGVGAALVQECIRRTRKAGIATLTLHTLEFMQVAMHMYEKLGFVHMPEMDIEPAPGVFVKMYRYDIEQ